MDSMASLGRNQETRSTSATIACTRVSSDGSLIEQETYGCQTCTIVHGTGMCRVCATLCHEGHELVYMGKLITACACSMRALTGACKCSTPIERDVIITAALESPPKVQLWCCSRCTVMNTIDLRECSVCSQKAPEGMSTLPSTSRALVAVLDSPATPSASASQPWSCAACTYLNTADAKICTICNSQAPTLSGPQAANGLVTLSQAAATTTAPLHIPVASPPTSWFCAACTMENKAGDKSCFMCATPRPEAEAIPTAVPVLPMAEVFPMETDDPPLANLTAPPSPTRVSYNEHNQKMRVEGVIVLNDFNLDRALRQRERSLSIPIQGDSTWDTTAGIMTTAISEHQPFMAHYINGEYLEKDGYIRGLSRFVLDSECSNNKKSGRWQLEGQFKKLSHSQENFVTLRWDLGTTRFDGKWYRGDGSGAWNCVAAPLVADFRGLAPIVPVTNGINSSTKMNSGDEQTTNLQPFYSGMINMKMNLTNVCYQNSFLQTLFLTQAFRRLILSVNYQIGSGVETLKCVQDLFARLLVSQRPHLDSHALQRCLPDIFQAGRQQDTSDFAHFLMEELSQQFTICAQTDRHINGISDVFGGTQATILVCKTCGKSSVNREYFWEFLLNMMDLRYTPITSITAITGTSPNDIATPPGYERLNSDLNKDRSGSPPYVYLCIKRKPETESLSFSNPDEELPITDIVIKVASMHDAKPTMAGYERVEVDLNIGGGTGVLGGKKQVYLFFQREVNGSPITDLQVIYGTEAVPDGFKKINVDLNQGDGGATTTVFLCYRCDMPITDLKIVESGIRGYKMVDHMLNLNTDANTVKQYLAYKVGGTEQCLTDLRLVPAAEVQSLMDHEIGWESLGAPLAATEPNGDQLMIRRGHGNPIFAIDVFRAPRQVPRYNDYEIIDLYATKNNLVSTANHSVNSVASLKGDWLASEEVDRSRKAVRFHLVTESNAEAFVVNGVFEDKGELRAIATVAPTWGAGDAAVGSTAAPSVDTFKRVLRMTGYWKSSKTNYSQHFDIEIRPNIPVNEGGTYVPYHLNGTVGDGRGRSVTITGKQISQKVCVKWPITEMFVIRGDERVPEGVEVIRETCSGRPGNLLVQTQSPHTLYVAVKRERRVSSEQEDVGGTGYVTDVSVVYGEIDAVPEGYTCIETTPSGFSANLNDGTVSGIPIMLCYRRSSLKTSSNKALMDLSLMWTSGPHIDTLPNGFTKLTHTPLGMDANLNQGTNGVSIHLCYSKCNPSDIATPIDDALNGEYEIITHIAPGGSPAPSLFGSFIRLAVVERVMGGAQSVEGKFGTVFAGQLPGVFRGTLYSTTTAIDASPTKPKRVITGFWMSDEQNVSSMIDFVPPKFPFEWTLNDAGNELDGWWSAEDTSSASTNKTQPATSPAKKTTSNNAIVAQSQGHVWKLMKDAYVRVAFKKDYGTEWRDGHLISSERVWRHDIATMLSRSAALRTLGGDNLLSCSGCQRKTESRAHTVVVAPPTHLIVTLKRMYYDGVQHKTRKCLHDVAFTPVMTLPSLSEDDEQMLYTPDDILNGVRDSERMRQYGLYGVLVHSGLTANSGHYYSFCRESDDRTHQLHLKDSPTAPWIKFNDMRVEPTNWSEVNRAVANSVSDTVYLLLYKRLSYIAPPTDESTAILDALAMEDVEMIKVSDAKSGDDEDEAMLLAKAMALSMSQAQQKVGVVAVSEHQKVNDEQKDDTAGLRRSNLINPTILKAIEEANAQFITELAMTATSEVHVNDLHTVVALRNGIRPFINEQ